MSHLETQDAMDRRTAGLKARVMVALKKSGLLKRPLLLSDDLAEPSVQLLQFVTALLAAQPDRPDDDGLLPLRDLPLYWRGRAAALGLLNDRRVVPDERTKQEIETYEECAKELRAALAANQPTRDGAEGAGDIVRCLETIEKCYDFRCPTGTIKNCGEWKYLKRLLAAPPKPAPDACTCGQSGHGNAHEPGCPRSDYKPTPRTMPAPAAMREAALTLVNKIRAGVRHGEGFTREECVEFVIKFAAPAPSPDGTGREIDRIRARLKTLCPIKVRCSCADGDWQWYGQDCANRVAQATREAISTSPSPAVAAEPDYETAAHALGFRQIPNGKWYHQGQDHDLERCFTSAQAIFDHYYGKHWLASPPVKGDREAPETIEGAIETVVERVNNYDDRTSPEDWPEALLITSEELRTELLRFAEAISLPVQPGAGEREVDPDLCAGGVDPGRDECPKCGTTMDDECYGELSRQAPPSSSEGGR